MLHEKYAAVKDQVAPCGIRCGDCAMGNGSVAETAGNLKMYIQMYELPSWAHELPGGAEIDFKQFDWDLTWVEKFLGCPGCHKGGGSPECPIRICSKEKGFSSCSQCSDLRSCAKFNWLGKKGEMLKTELIEQH
jgi:hypothetical protein